MKIFIIKHNEHRNGRTSFYYDRRFNDEASAVDWMVAAAAADNFRGFAKIDEIIAALEAIDNTTGLVQSLFASVIDNLNAFEHYFEPNPDERLLLKPILKDHNGTVIWTAGDTSIDYGDYTESVESIDTEAPDCPEQFAEFVDDDDDNDAD